MTGPDTNSSPGGAERREHPREPILRAAKLVLATGRTLDATIVDRSLKGMRIRLQTLEDLPKAITVLEIDRLTIHEGLIVWIAAQDVGVRLAVSHPLHSLEGPAGARLRRLWSTSLAR